MLATAYTKKIFLCAVIAGFTAFPFLAKAEKTELGLTPFLVQQDVSRGQVFNGIVKISNTGEKEKSVSLSLHDFFPVGRRGEVEFLPVGKKSSSANSLVDWLTITKQPQHILLPGQVSQVEFLVKVPKDVEPGAHFGALVVTMSDTGEQNLAGQSAIVAKAATLLIFDLERSYERAEIEFFGQANVGNQSNQLSFLTAIKNSGLSSLQPKGKINIYNWYGGFVGTAYVNKDALNILPATSREFASLLGGSFYGRYTAKLNLTYGSKKLAVQSELSFWVWPDLVTAIRLGVYFIVVIIVLVLLVRKYNRWLVARFKKYEK